MPYRRRRLQTGIKGVRGIDRAVTQCAADDLVVAWIGIEKELGGDMAEQMRMDPQSGVGADGSRDLGPKKRLVLGACPNSGEQRRIACQCQVRSKFPNVALDELDAFRRQRVLKRLPVLDLFGADNDVKRPAPPWPD